MLLLILQILARQAPVKTVDAESKYVKFSEIDEPHPRVTVNENSNA